MPWAHLHCWQNQHVSSSVPVCFSLDAPEPSLVLPQNSIIWGLCFNFCFSRFKTHWDHFYLGSCLFLQSRLFLNCVLMVLLLYSSKKTLSFSFKVTVCLHNLWIGPLMAIAVIILLWMEIRISSLAGMALLIILMLLQSFSGKLFFITPVRETLV